MKPFKTSSRHVDAALRYAVFLSLLVAAVAVRAQTPVTNNPPQYGPYNAVFLFGGEGLKEGMVENDTVLQADSPWSMYCWVRFEEPLQKPTLIAGMGDPKEEYPRYLGADAQHVFYWMGQDNQLTAQASLAPEEWHLLAATFDGTQFHLFVDGEPVAGGALLLGTVGPVLQMAPPKFPITGGTHFGGKIAAFTILRQALTSDEIKRLYRQREDFSLIEFEEGSKHWPVQTRGQAGYQAPQDPSTMPHGKAPLSKPVALPVPVPVRRSPWESVGDNAWQIAGDWRLKAAPDVSATAAEISAARFDASNWLTAVVPGTVLTTLVDRGVYPDPAYGLNNLAIPESLNKHDYWYRVALKSPEALNGKRLTLTFDGINYAADVWLNGRQLGAIKGAFIRGNFDVTGIWRAGKNEENVLAVRVSPPPHPGIPNEESMKGGPGENGGIMVLDGPTFMASEGWDWIPGVRDRETGIWQPVVLRATGPVEIGDPQVITKLPLPDTSRADIEIRVPLRNDSAKPVRGSLEASFEGVSVTKNVELPSGETTVNLAPAEFKQLNVENPRLWWPNGYGEQGLYHLNLVFDAAGQESDAKQLQFGVREITYELSLIDHDGHLRRVEVDPTLGKVGLEGVVDTTHRGIREIPAADPMPPDLPKRWRAFWHSWVESLGPNGDSSPAVRPSDDTATAPYLVIKVNGVRIACRGGSWGMDDFMKRVSPEHLEPYFRLQHDANLNMIRNWMGQDTEESFYDLADKYGFLIWNDFWETTENYNLEPEDPALFLANARDVILRDRNHPSIALWCGRNEGVPQPVVNQGLAKLADTLDGTRYYSPSSNEVDLQGSGPYKYQDPKLYFTRLNHGFSVETGTASMPTLESFESFIPKPDRWPIDDVWAYHDWHQSGNGDVAPFMAQIQAEFGAATSLSDFERKAQMLDYVDHRAIFEGMNAHLWSPNSGRLLWMTQPAWPSTMWQILSHDYDTQASFYGVKKACEPIHIQMDLSNYQVAVVNTTRAAMNTLSAEATVYSLANKLLAQHEQKKDVAADSAVNAFKLDLAPLLAQNDVVLVKLNLRNASGELLSQNLYWLAAEDASYRALDRLAPAQLATNANATRDGGTTTVHVQLKNTGTDAALQTKLTLLNAADGSRILPAYYSDNYVSLLAGESRDITIEYPKSAAHSAPAVAIRGWNLAPVRVSIVLEN
jgi:Glycosyl hydrolase 2 galactose-binding domain-like/Exo-beta-D-glucosaminidase Ig-fold domain/Concanavalin A-like lectin/glucanases superfamily/Glycosyl hydrolases family 2/Glycosyl hydrolases family 2, TIM barrel domain